MIQIPGRPPCYSKHSPKRSGYTSALIRSHPKQAFETEGRNLQNLAPAISDLGRSTFPRFNNVFWVGCHRHSVSSAMTIQHWSIFLGGCVPRLPRGSTPICPRKALEKTGRKKKKKKKTLQLRPHIRRVTLKALCPLGKASYEDLVQRNFALQLADRYGARHDKFARRECACARRP